MAYEVVANLRGPIGPEGPPVSDEKVSAALGARLYRGDLPAGTDLNRFGGNGDNGSWRISATGHTNGPGIASSGVLEVIRMPGVNGVFAVVQRITTAEGMWWREAIDYGTYSWGSWRKAATTDEAVTTHGVIPDGADLNSYRLREHAGTYSILSTGTYLNAPSIDYAGIFEVLPAAGNNFSCAQRITTQASAFWREAIDHGAGQWGAWKRVATMDDIIGGGGGGSVLAPATIAYSESADGLTTFVHGDADHRLERGVASITKTFTVWTARQHLTAAELDGTATVQAGDMSGSPHLKVGDVVKLRDLCYAAMVSSDSTAPTVLARVVGTKLDPGAANPVTVFRAEMEAEAARLGYEGAAFPMVISGAQVSARMVVDMFRRFRADPELRPMPAALTYSFTVTGPDPRTINIAHTIDPNGAVPIPGFRAGKTGTTNGMSHVVVEWRHPDGTDHITAILWCWEDIPNQRYLELRKVIDATKAITAEILGAPAHLRDYIRQMVGEVAQAPANTVIDARLDQRRGAADGVASLDSSSRVPVSQIPVVAVADEANARPTPTTGSRNMAGSFPTADLTTTGALIRLAKTGFLVEFTMASVKFPGTTLQIDGVIPEGYRPMNNVYATVLRGIGPDVCEVQVTPSGRVRIQGFTAGQELKFTMHWMSPGVFPSAPYPGTTPA